MWANMDLKMNVELNACLWNSLCRQIEQSCNKLLLRRQVWRLMVIRKSLLKIPTICKKNGLTENLQINGLSYVSSTIWFTLSQCLQTEGVNLPEHRYKNGRDGNLRHPVQWHDDRQFIGKADEFLDGQCACCSAMFIKLPECYLKLEWVSQKISCAWRTHSITMARWPKMSCFMWCVKSDLAFLCLSFHQHSWWVLVSSGMAEFFLGGTILRIFSQCLRQKVTAVEIAACYSCV